MTTVQTAHLPLDAIHPSNFNPRKYFDKNLLGELSESIKQDGVIQPIVVRPLNEGYEIVAGERRYRASQLAGLDAIPCTIKDIDDETAIRLATKENLEREDMSIIEESYAAQSALTLVEGDRKAACSVLSWTEQKLNKRLLLLNLCKKGQDMLMKKKINIGHAELISSLSEAMQEKAIESVIEKGISVAELKSKLAEYAYQLSAAIFNTEGCNGCPNNSSTQFALFDECVGEGQCMKPECYEDKQQNKLAYIKKSKEEDYNVVYLDVERTRDSYNYIQATKVGMEQFSQCQQCGKCGALISTRVETLGSTDDDVCFDTKCYDEKVQANNPQDTVAVTTQAVSKKATSKQASKTKKAADNKPPKKVLEYKTRLYKTIVAKELATDAHLMLAMNAAILLEALPKQHLGSELNDKLKGFFQLPDTLGKCTSHKREDNIKALYALEDAVLHEIIAYATTVNATAGANSFDLSAEDRPVMALLDILKPELAEHFVMDDEFLQANPKVGMIGLLKEAGFDVFYNAKEGKDDAFNKLAKGTIKAIVEKVKTSGFAMKGFVPKALYYKGYINHVRGEAPATQDAA